MNTKLKSPTFLLFFLLCSCGTSSHNLKKDGDNLFGGGYSINKLSDNEYYIVTKTNVTPWKNTSAARSM